MRSFFQGKVGKERGSCFHVSNLSVMKVEGKGKGQWEIGRVIFSRSAFVSGSAIAVGVMTGGDRCLTMGFCWQEGAVERDVVEMVVEKVSVGIEGLAREMES